MSRTAFDNSTRRLLCAASILLTLTFAGCTEDGALESAGRIDLEDAGITTGSGEAIPNAELSDENIAAALSTEFIHDPAIPYNRVDIHVSDGIVTLEGEMSNLLAGQRAVRLAKTVKGVRAVIDKFSAVPISTVTDAALADRIDEAFLRDPVADSYELDVRVSEGVATLSGTVQSIAERQLAEKVAAGVYGVRGIENQIRISPEENRPDNEIKPEIEASLRFDTLIDHLLVRVAVDNGSVTLTGTVGSAAEKNRAMDIAGSVNGVVLVDGSGLKVEKWARDPLLRGDKYVIKDEAAVEKALRATFNRDPRLYRFDISPTVQDGIVVLRGTVDNLKAKHAASRDARNTVGVHWVTNHIQVRPTKDHADSDIARAVERAVEVDPYVSHHDISVSVINGNVYLDGRVNTQFERARIDEIVSGMVGVTAIHNNLEVDDMNSIYTYSPYVDDWGPIDPQYRVKQNGSFLDDRRIRHEIEHNISWNPFLNNEEIRISVEKGTAYLTGKVGSITERRAAEEAAFKGGAVDIRNQLTVE